MIPPGKEIFLKFLFKRKEASRLMPLLVSLPTHEDDEQQSSATAAKGGRFLRIK
jgi:hypothetical protein